MFNRRPVLGAFDWPRILLESLMTPDDYCADKVRQSGSSFSDSFRFLDPPRRQAITALYAFCREVDDVVDECHEPAIARAKLDWWRDELDELEGGQPEHPVTQALARAREQFDLPVEQLGEIIDGMEMDLELPRYADFTQLQLYCHRVAGVVGLLSAEIFGYSDRHTLKYAHTLGLAFQLTNIIRDVGEDARRNRIYLPQDELARFGVQRSGHPEQSPHAGIRRADGFSGAARPRTLRRAPSPNCPPPTARRSAPASSWPRSTARCSTRSSATASSCSTAAPRCRPRASSGSP